MTPTPVRPIRIADATWEAVAEAAASLGVSASEFVREAIAEKLARQASDSESHG